MKKASCAMAILTLVATMMAFQVGDILLQAITKAVVSHYIQVALTCCTVQTQLCCRPSLTRRSLSGAGVFTKSSHLENLCCGSMVRRAFHY